MDTALEKLERDTMLEKLERESTSPGRVAFNPDGMDAAAEEAAKGLEELPPEAVKVVAEWWARWYLRAGHKRLGRLLVRRV